MKFSDERNQKSISVFLSNAHRLSTSTEAEEICKKFTIAIMEFFKTNPETWDSRCSFNLEHIGDHYFSAIGNFSYSNASGISDICSMTHRFVCEYEFKLEPKTELSPDIRTLMNLIEKNLSKMDAEFHSQYLYAKLTMPTNIARSILNDPEFTNFRDFKSNLEIAKSSNIEWDADFQNKKGAVEELKNALNTYKTGFNFVGLYSGFENLKTTLEKRQFAQLFWLRIMGFITILLPVLELFLLNARTETISASLLIYLPLTVTIEILLIYFFRIILHSYNSTKTQKMQIELRQTLCQFIQSYSDYSKEIKDKDPSALEKFENLIFSGIMSDPEKLPSTYDGMDQISNLVKSLKAS